MSKYDMSLDDIIKRQSGRERKQFRSRRNTNRNNGFGAQNPRQQQQSSFRTKNGSFKRNTTFVNSVRLTTNRSAAAGISDARNKITGNKRPVIRDARERLNMNMRTKDVRVKLLQMQKKKGFIKSGTQRNNLTLQRNQTKQILNSLKRTIQVDKTPSPPRKRLQLHGGEIRVIKTDVDLPRAHKNFVKPKRMSQMTVEMKRRLSPTASPSAGLGYKVLVTNLHPSVSQVDIVELFGDVGDLTRAVLVRSGVAEVVFSQSEDALAAVETYHNRDLDGRPMVCKVVTPIPADMSTYSTDVGLSSGIRTAGLHSDRIGGSLHRRGQFKGPSRPIVKDRAVFTINLNK